MQINRYHQSIVSHAILLSCMLCCAKQPSEPHNILIRFKIRSAKQTYNKQKHSTVYLAFWTCFHSKTCLSSALSIYCKASHLNCTFRTFNHSSVAQFILFSLNLSLSSPSVNVHNKLLHWLRQEKKRQNQQKSMFDFRLYFPCAISVLNLAISNQLNVSDGLSTRLSLPT